MKRLILTTLLLGMTTQVVAEPPAPTHDHGSMMQGGPARLWTQLPLLKPRMGGESREVRILPQNIEVPAIEAWSNNLHDAQAQRSLPVELGGAALDKPATGGFQMLTAREEQGDTVRVASTVHYFGERGGKNPTAMFDQVKQELEIVPQPYPREHSRYRANEDWRFLVRYKGQPLAGSLVQLETSNGSQAELHTDAQGIVTVHIPADFQAEANKQAGAASHGMRRSADFVLAATHVAEGRNYLTAFNSSYGPDAYDQRDLVMGVGFMLLGMLGAAPLLHKRKDKEADHA